MNKFHILSINFSAHGLRLHRGEQQLCVFPAELSPVSYVLLKWTNKKLKLRGKIQELFLSLSLYLFSFLTDFFVSQSFSDQYFYHFFRESTSFLAPFCISFQSFLLPSFPGANVLESRRHLCAPRLKFYVYYLPSIFSLFFHCRFFFF